MLQPFLVPLLAAADWKVLAVEIVIALSVEVRGWTEVIIGVMLLTPWTLRTLGLAEPAVPGAEPPIVVVSWATVVRSAPPPVAPAPVKTLVPPTFPKLTKSILSVVSWAAPPCPEDKLDTLEV